MYFLGDAHCVQFRSIVLLSTNKIKPRTKSTAITSTGAQTSNPTIGGGEGIGEKYLLLHGECDQKSPSRVWDRISR